MLLATAESRSDSAAIAGSGMAAESERLSAAMPSPAMAKAVKSVIVLGSARLLRPGSVDGNRQHFDNLRCKTCCRLVLNGVLGGRDFFLIQVNTVAVQCYRCSDLILHRSRGSPRQIVPTW